jgi:hypothetical protein
MIKGETVQPQIGKFQSGVIMMKEYKILGGKMNEIFGSILRMPCSPKQTEPI